MYHKLSDKQLIGISQIAYDIIHNRNIRIYNKKKLSEILNKYKFNEIEYNFCLLRCKKEIEKLNEKSIFHEQKHLFNYN